LAVTIDELPDDIELLKKQVVDLITRSRSLEQQRDTLEQQRDTLERQRDTLERQRDSLHLQNQNLEARTLYLEAKLAEFLQRRASSKQEQIADGQLLLAFAHELAEAAREQLDQALADSEDKVEQEPPSSGDRRQGKRGRRPLPLDLPRFRSVYELDADQRLCSCGVAMPEIGEITSEELVRLDMLFVHQHARMKYACNRCEDGVLVAPGPERVLPKSMAGPSLLAWTINAKFGDHLPYYRLEQILDREGAPVSRATLCNWMAGCSEVLQPVANEVRRQILASDYVQTDDTSKLIQRGKEGSSCYGHVWVYATPDGKVYYDFTETRERHGPLNVLGEFEGYVQADAYSGYDELFRRGKAVEVGCWAHAKRKFDDAKETDPISAGKALAAIRRLYDIERDASRQEMTADERKALRQERAPPILAALLEWLEAESLRALPRSAMAQAMGYVLNQWNALNRYLEDGRIEIDNNRAERLMKPVAIGRKNDLFVFTEETGQKATVLMSLVESCKTIGVDPRVYFNDVLQELRNEAGVDVASLTPWAWKRRRDQDALRQQERAQSQAQLAAAVLAVVRR
jgi:transposase